MAALKKVHELIRDGKYYEALELLVELRKTNPNFLPYEQCYEYLKKKIKGIRPNLKSSNFQGQGDLSILFVLPGPLDSNNGYQVQLLARNLRTIGVKSTIAVPDEIPVRDTGNSEFSVFNYSFFYMADQGSYSLIHAWTPREIVREFCERYLKKYNIPLVVHLEDNEEYLTSVSVGISWEELNSLSIEELDNIIPINRYHPHRGRKFIESAVGLTLVIETLNRYNSRRIPYILLPPIADERLFYPRPINYSLRQKLGISNDYTVLCYTGVVHEANYKDVFELYKAVEILNTEGHRTVLLRTGLDQDKLTLNWPKNHVINLGLVKREEVPEIMAAADILIQPGGNTAFDKERFPCKIPEYFAIGRPIIMSKNDYWNVSLEHLKEAYLVFRTDADSIARAVKDIKSNDYLIKILTEGSVNYYLKEFKKDRREIIKDFYERLINLNKTFLCNDVIKRSQIQSRKFISKVPQCIERSLNTKEIYFEKKEVLDYINNELGLNFYMLQYFTYESFDSVLVDFYSGEKKSIYVIIDEHSNLSILKVLIDNLSSSVLYIILVSDDGIDITRKNLLEIYKPNIYLLFAKAIKNSDYFIKNLLSGKQNIYKRILFLKNLSFLSNEAVEFTDAFVLDLRQSKLRLEDEIECTLITSIWNSEKFINNFFKNITKLNGYDSNIAHMIFISSISDYELELIFAWFLKYSNVAIFWNRYDPGLYECWNTGIKLTKSEFISNANVDDLRHPNQVKTLIKELKKRPNISIACTVYVPFYELYDDVSKIPINEIWFTHQVGEFGFLELAYLEKDEKGNYILRPNNIPHCMPVWRKKLHEFYGYFEEKVYGPYADWAFWLKVTLAGERGYLHPEPLSFYYINPDSHNRRGDKLIEFHKKIEKEYLPHFYCLKYNIM